jgi:hypothetical protein
MGSVGFEVGVEDEEENEDEDAGKGSPSPNAIEDRDPLKTHEVATGCEEACKH